MKKITLFMIALFVMPSLFAKDATDAAGSNRKGKMTSHALPAQTMRVSSHSNNAISTVPFYTEDFTTGIPTGWSNVSLTINNFLWAWTIQGSTNANPGFDSLSVTGTTSATGFMKFDSDSSGTTHTGGEDAILTSTAINCTGHPAVHLTLNEYFLQYTTSTGTISVSNDSITWNVVHHAETGLGQNQGTPNPKVLDIDISTYAANQATVYVRFEYIGNWDYWWFIDDLGLFEPPATDAGVNSVAVDFNSCALSATEPVSVVIQNNGGSPISGFPVSYVVNGGTAVTETYAGTLNGGDTVTYTFTQTTDMSVAGLYMVEAYTGLVGDANNANDSSSTVTASYDHIDPSVASYTMGFEASEDYSAWTIQDVDGDGVTFDIANTYQYGGALCLRKPGSGVDDNNWLFTQCVDIVSGGTTYLSYWYKNFELANPCSLEVYVGTGNDSASMTTMVVQSPIPADTTYHQTIGQIAVAPGTYYLGFHFYSNQGTGTSSLRLDNISIDFTTGIKESPVASSIGVFPNPSSGIINIKNSNSSDKEFRLNIYNSVGQLVYSKKYNNLVNEQVDLTGQPNGVYSVQLKSDKNTINKSVVISNN